jgi:hypothetical protein
MTMMRGTFHPIEGGIGMTIFITAGRGVRVGKDDEGERGAQKDVTMIGMNVITSTNLVQEGGREAEVAARVEKIQEESGVLEGMIENTKALTARVVGERMIGINTTIRSNRKR